jgi:hypothetical protein
MCSQTVFLEGVPSMKKYILFMVALVSVFSANVAVAARADDCAKEIKEAVQAAAKSIGIQEEIGFDLQLTGKRFKTHLGEQLVEYATSTFIIADGYLPGSGATVAVKPGAGSCEIVRLKIHAR